MPSNVVQAAAAAASSSAKKRMLVFGGNGFVGSAVCKTAIAHGWDVVVLCRSGIAANPADEWVSKATWEMVDALDRSVVYDLLEHYNSDGNTKAVVSSIGLLTIDGPVGRRVNGDPTLNIAAAIHAKKITSLDKTVFISAADMQPVNRVLKGYYYGKRSAEKGLRDYTNGKYAIMRPGMIYGNRSIMEGRYTIPIGLAGYPMELIFNPLHRMLPFSILTPPVSVTTLAKAVVTVCGDSAEVGTFEYKDFHSLAEKLQ